MKLYNEMFNIGKAKYVINTHDGVQTHKDGSPFFGIDISSNKKDHERKLKALRGDGYVRQGINLS